MDITFILHDWAVLSMTSPGATQPQISPGRHHPVTRALEGPYIFSFFIYQNSKVVGASLDVNACGGSAFDIPSKGKITIGNFGCEKAGGDSYFAMAMIQLAPKLAEYVIKGDTLTLMGPGTMNGDTNLKGTGEIKMKQL